MSSDKRPRASDDRYKNPVREGLEATGLYHSFELPDGRVLAGANSIEHQRERLAAFDLPDDLTGKRVLDIGPWDGFFTFEMERRGAEVMAVDYTDLDTFREIHRHLNSKVRYEQMEIYELTPERVGTFDVVLCLGVLYHLKHPLLALERVCAVTRDRAIIDTFVVDGEAWRAGGARSMPYVEFYETDELAGRTDNWCGPTVGAVEAMIRAAGFASAIVLRVFGRSAIVAAGRRRRDLPPEEFPLELTDVRSHRDPGRSFESSREEYLLLRCDGDANSPPTLNEIFPEIDGYGVAPIAQALDGGDLVVSARLPPGLAAGEHTVRLKIGNSQWSRLERFYVDLPPLTGAFELISVQDGLNWDLGRVDWGNGGWLTVWVRGLSDEADCGNVRVSVDGVPHVPEKIAVATGQINLRLRRVVRAGSHVIRVRHRSAETRGQRIEVVGARPVIRGLEKLES